MTRFGKQTIDHGIVNVTPKPSEQELSEYYAKAYYQESDGKTSTYDVTYTDSEIAYKKLEAQLSLEALRERRTAGVKGLSALDLGCGEGFVVKEFIDAGVPTTGVDFSSFGVEKWNPSVKDSCWFGNVYQYLDKAVSEGRTFDVCILRNVLEHVLEPAALVRTIGKVIPADGLALITIPNDYSDLQLRAMELGHIDREFWFAPPDHLTYFNTKNIGPFMADNGFEVLDMFTSFPVDFFLYHPGSNYIADKTKGKGAHHARIDIDLMMAKEGIGNLLALYRSMAACGVGRDMTVVVRRA